MDVVAIQAAKAAARSTYPNPPDVQVFTSTGTWTKPAGAKWLEILVIDGGAGGGSGRRGAAGTVRCGGGGGAGAGSTVARMRASDLPAFVAVTVGAGGAGGAAITVNDTDGAVGAVGIASLFGTYVRTAVRPNFGSGGTNATGLGGNASSNAGGTGPSAAGGAANTAGGAGQNGSGQGSVTNGFAYAGCGGAAGGGISSGDTANNGGVGGNAAYLINSGGASGVVDTTTPTTVNAATPGPGASGGGGGAASKTTAAQAGADGGKWGGGGGGGGASLNGNNSGKGGNGGSGLVVVVSHFDALTDTGDWAALGDSLTNGTGATATTNVPADLAALLNKKVDNLGVGGETSTQIAARIGGVATTLVTTGASIPASGSVNTTPSSSVPSAQGSPISGVVSGVHGTLTYGTPVTFTRHEAAAGATASPDGSTFVPDMAAAVAWRRFIIWAGRNNFASSAQVQADIAAMAALTRTGKYLVLSVLNASGEGTGTNNYNQIVALNAALAATYGSRYIDIRSYLITNGLADAGITPTTQDNTDIANDIVPTSLRFDNIHLLAAGYTIVAARIQAKITALGW